uniref:Uncharacterized protein n=1 Tax=Leptospirillum ferriphilum TaxID=178606 RepID=A0A7C3QWY0_9BACT
MSPHTEKRTDHELQNRTTLLAINILTRRPPLPQPELLPDPHPEMTFPRTDPPRPDPGTPETL